jgi:hypothetical protein
LGAKKDGYYDLSYFKDICRLHLLSSKHRISAKIPSKSTTVKLTASNHKGITSKNKAWNRQKMQLSQTNKYNP